MPFLIYKWGWTVPALPALQGFLRGLNKTDVKILQKFKNTLSSITMLIKMKLLISIVIYNLKRQKSEEASLFNLLIKVTTDD